MVFFGLAAKIVDSKRPVEGALPPFITRGPIPFWRLLQLFHGENGRGLETPPSPAEMNHAGSERKRSSCFGVTWVCLRINQEGLRRFWSMFPRTRGPFWDRSFGPLTPRMPFGLPLEHDVCSGPRPKALEEPNLTLRGRHQHRPHEDDHPSMPLSYLNSVFWAEKWPRLSWWLSWWFLFWCFFFLSLAVFLVVFLVVFLLVFLLCVSFF